MHSAEGTFSSVSSVQFSFDRNLCTRLEGTFSQSVSQFSSGRNLCTLLEGTFQSVIGQPTRDQAFEGIAAGDDCDSPHKEGGGLAC